VPVGVLVTALSLAALAVPGTAAVTPPAPGLRPPLATAVSTPTGSWAVVAMGHLDDPTNTFWELFFRPAGTARWALVTPPGVADNGGLVAAVPTGVADAGSATVGFEPSQLLRFSPLAQATDGGGTWAPALLPAALLADPDALAYQPAAPGVAGRALALVRSGGGEVLVSTTSLLGWAPLGADGALSALAGRSCGVDGLDAVALGSGEAALVGTGCRRPGQVGVFTLEGDRWQLTGPTLSGSSARWATRVLRLDVSASMTSGLVAEGSGKHTSLLALWRPDGGAWSVSPPLSVGASAKLLSTALGTGGEMVVLVEGPRGNRMVEEVSGPGRAWSVLPLAPSGTATLAPLPGGSVDAFAVNGAHLVVYTLDPGASSWVRSQSLDVPIAYGSSS
jgi:hypothetical protein